MNFYAIRFAFVYNLVCCLFFGSFEKWSETLLFRSEKKNSISIVFTCRHFWLTFALGKLKYMANQLINFVNNGHIHLVPSSQSAVGCRCDAKWCVQTFRLHSIAVDWKCLGPHQYCSRCLPSLVYTNEQLIAFFALNIYKAVPVWTNKEGKRAHFTKRTVYAAHLSISMNQIQSKSIFSPSQCCMCVWNECMICLCLAKF